VHRCDDGLGPLAVEAPWISTVLWHGVAPLSDVRGHADQVEPRGEVLAVRDEDTCPQVVVALQ
jgi:hypothetical protein